MIKMASGADERVRRMLNFLRYMCMILGDQESSCTPRLCSRAKGDKKLECTSILVPYCCETSEEIDIGGIQHDLSVRTAHIKCLSTIEVMRQQRWMKARTMRVTCQPMAKKEAFITYLAQ